MARIVFITSRYPFPASKGDQLRAYFQILSLAKNHELHLISLDENEIEEDQKARLSECASISCYKISRVKRWLNTFTALFSRLPFQVAHFTDRKVKREILSQIAGIQPDVVHCHLIRSAEYVKDINGIHKSLDFMDAFSAGMRKRLAIEKNPFKKIVFYIEYRRLLRYETLMFRSFDRFCIISEQDKMLLNNPLNREIEVIPNGVDDSVFYPRKAVNRADLCFMGNMDYPPNAEAVRYFVTHVFPKLLKIDPKITFLIAGANPPKFIRKYAGSNIFVADHFDDISEAIAQSTIMVSPLIISIGLANKVIQAMAMKVPNVVSPPVAAAIGGIHRKHLLVAGTDREFVELLLELLENHELREFITENAFELVRTEFTWQKVNQKFDRFFQY